MLLTIHSAHPAFLLCAKSIKVSKRFLHKCAQPHDDSTYMYLHTLSQSLSLIVDGLLTFTVPEGNFESSKNMLDILPGSNTIVVVKAVVVLNRWERDGQEDGHLCACYRCATSSV